MRKPVYSRAHNAAIGQRLRRLRDGRAWSLEQLAAALSENGSLVTTSQISKLERGAQQFTAAWLFRLSDALQCPIVDLLSDNPIPLPSQMLADKIQGLSEPDRQAAERIIDAMSQSATNATPPPASRRRVRRR